LTKPASLRRASQKEFYAGQENIFSQKVITLYYIFFYFVLKVSAMKGVEDL